MLRHFKTSLVRLSNQISAAGTVAIIIPTWLFYSLIGYLAFRILRRPIVAVLSTGFFIFTHLGRLAANLLLGLLRRPARRLVDRLSYTREHKRESFARMILILIIIVLLIKLDAFRRSRLTSEETAEMDL